MMDAFGHDNVSSSVCLHCPAEVATGSPSSARPKVGLASTHEQTFDVAYMARCAPARAQNLTIRTGAPVLLSPASENFSPEDMIYKYKVRSSAVHYRRFARRTVWPRRFKL